MPLALYYGAHPITEGFEGVPSIYPIVQSIQSAEEPPERISPTDLSPRDGIEFEAAEGLIEAKTRQLVRHPANLHRAIRGDAHMR